MTDNNKFDLSKLNPNINNIKLKANINIKSFINLNRLNVPSVKAPEIDTFKLLSKDKPKEKKGFEKIYENHVGKFAIFMFLLGVIVTVLISYLFK